MFKLSAVKPYPVSRKSQKTPTGRRFVGCFAAELFVSLRRMTGISGKLLPESVLFAKIRVYISEGEPEWSHKAIFVAFGLFNKNI